MHGRLAREPSPSQVVHSCLESYASLLDPINLLAIIRVSFDALAVPRNASGEADPR